MRRKGAERSIEEEAVGVVGHSDGNGDEMRRTTLLPASVGIAVLLACAVVLPATLASAPAASAASRGNGASFAVRCDFSHRLHDDPIVYHGKPGASHSHDFFGNRSTRARSGYRGLLAADTTCTRKMDKAAYWIPTVRWNGNTLNSIRAVFYYRAGGKDHTKVKPFPANLKMITNSHVTWRCGRADRGGGTKSPPRRCRSGKLGVRIMFPDCSKGTLDSHNHRAHMAYSRRINGKVRCPSTHPIPVPVLTTNVTFPIPTTRGKVTLSSGRASTMHADFWNAWRQQTLTFLVKHCINNVPPSKPRPAECRA